MAALFASWWRGSMSCGLMMLTCAGLLTVPAQGSTGEVASFAQTAVVTHWSLPLASPKVGAMPEPAFSLFLASETALQNGANPSVDPASPPTSSPPQTAGSNGRTLPAEEQEAPWVATYDRGRPYRTPSDIKALEVAFQLLNAADAITTVVCLNRDNCHENNPIFGKHPKPIVVVGAKAAVGALHYLAMRSLLPDNPGLARALGWVSVTVQGTVVGLNLSQLF